MSEIKIGTYISLFDIDCHIFTNSVVVVFSVENSAIVVVLVVVGKISQICLRLWAVHELSSSSVAPGHVGSHCQE